MLEKLIKKIEEYSEYMNENGIAINKLKDRKKEISKTLNIFTKEIENKKNEILTLMNEADEKSIKTMSGTMVSISKGRGSVSITDLEAIKVKDENGKFIYEDILNIEPGKAKIQDYYKKTGELPAGCKFVYNDSLIIKQEEAVK